MSVVLGIDSSTQSTKVEARQINTGQVLGQARADHPATNPPISEQDPRAWWDALTSAIHQLGDIRHQVTALSVAGQQHGLVLLDDDGEPVCPAQLWNDTRCAAEAAQLVRSGGASLWAQGCGSLPVASFTIAKLAWMAAHEPAALERVAKVMLPHDYLTWRLTGEHVTDRGDASGTGWFDATTDEYRSDLLDLAVAQSDQWINRLPTVISHETAAGVVSSPVATALGLSPTVLVGAGTGDNMAAAVGLGLRPGDVALSLGTSGTVFSVSTSPTADQSGAVAGFADATGHFLPLVCTLNATKVTDTVARWFGTDASGLSELALDAGSGFDGTLLIPYFDGERTPNLPEATGRFNGLRTSTTRETMARAAHDGVLCGLLSGLEALRAAGVASDGRLHLIGGGARSAAYQQRCADLHGQPIVIPEADETVATGAAVQAAMLAKDHTLNELISTWGLGRGPTVEPADDCRGLRDAYNASVAELRSDPR